MLTTVDKLTSVRVEEITNLTISHPFFYSWFLYYATFFFPFFCYNKCTLILGCGGREGPDGVEDLMILERKPVNPKSHTSLFRHPTSLLPLLLLYIPGDEEAALERYPTTGWHETGPRYSMGKGEKTKEEEKSHRKRKEIPTRRNVLVRMYVSLMAIMSLNDSHDILVSYLLFLTLPT